MKFERGNDPKSTMGIGRGKYSKKEFKGYRYRATVEVTYISDKKIQETNIDVYTDQNDRDKAEMEIISRAKDRVKIVRIINWTSALQDELSAAFIDEILKDM